MKQILIKLFICQRSISISNWTKSPGLKYLNDSKAFIQSSNNMDDIYQTIEEYNPNKKQKKIIIFDYMIADIHNNKKT